MERSPQFLRTEATQRSYWVCSIDRRCAASQRRRPSDPAAMRRTRSVILVGVFSGDGRWRCWWSEVEALKLNQGGVFGCFVADNSL